MGLRSKGHPNYSWEGSEILITIVEVAAWAFIWKTAYDVGANRRRRLEHKAVIAEYEDRQNLANEVDESQPRWMQEQTRERQLERRRQLLMRYPQVLIDRPDWRYYRQVQEAEKAEKVPFKESLKENWEWWLGATIGVLGWLAIHYIPKLLWAST